MRIAVVGGGINGLSCAWLLAEAGYKVDLYERGKLASETSRASSKLLHGGIRYLEQYKFRLVREALKERDEWLKRVPTLTCPLRLIMPIYKNSSRNKWVIGFGLLIYDHLAGKSILPPSTWLTAEDLLNIDPNLQSNGLLGGYEFSDAQMDDYKLAIWVADQARAIGVNIKENQQVERIDLKGNLYLGGQRYSFDFVVNASGPWAVKLLENSGITCSYRLDTVRGSHIVVSRNCKQSYLLEVPNEKRIFFVLPWQGNTLIGTTEIRQRVDDDIACSQEEKEYLLKAYNHYRKDFLRKEDIVDCFAGVRPLIYSAEDPNKASREYIIEREGKLFNIFGGKWTTALALARRLVNQVDKTNG
jgi:glycerol-3-phosphate dehydrogenase